MSCRMLEFLSGILKQLLPRLSPKPQQALQSKKVNNVGKHSTLACTPLTQEAHGLKCRGFRFLFPRVCTGTGKRLWLRGFGQGLAERLERFSFLAALEPVLLAR